VTTIQYNNVKKSSIACPSAQISLTDRMCDDVTGVQKYLITQRSRYNKNIICHYNLIQLFPKHAMLESCNVFLYFHNFSYTNLGPTATWSQESELNNQ